MQANLHSTGRCSFAQQEAVVTQDTSPGLAKVFFLPGHQGLPEETCVRVADAVRSFGELVTCAELLQAGSSGAVAELDGKVPIVAFQLRLPRVQRGLDELARVNAATCPDTYWALGLNSARARAELRLGAVWRCLLRNPPVPGALDDRLTASIGGLADALRKLRLVIVQRYPETLDAA